VSTAVTWRVSRRCLKRLAGSVSPSFGSEFPFPRQAACQAAHAHKHTHPFYSSLHFVQDNPVEMVPEETFTHSHQSWSSVVPYLLHPSNTVHGIILVQFTCVFFHNLSPSFLWSTSWPAPSTSYSIHFFTQSLSSFRSTCPYYRNLVCCSTEIMSSNPSLSLNPFLELYLVASHHTSI